MPPEALSILTGKGEELGHALAAHPLVQMLTFTGSREVGLSLPVHAGAKRIEMELDTIGVLVACPSADPEQVADEVACCGFMMAGQSATSIQHVWAHQSLFEPLANALRERVVRLRWGDPMDENTSLAPLIHPHALERVARWVDDAILHGACVLAGAKAEPPFYLPTILTEVPPTCTLHSEAVFGPIVALHAYETPHELLQHLNRFSIGVRLAVYTRDIAEAFELARHARALSVHINDTPTLPIDPIVRGDMQEHHMCFEDMLQRIERLSQPKYVGFGRMALF